MTVCLYCENEKSLVDFSNEHIWPDALGGESLPPFWKTNQVCRTCNNMSGLFVDGAFIKSWVGNAERWTEGIYAESKTPTKVNMPLAYLGKVLDVPIEPGKTAEYWTTACGANIVHIRPDDKEKLWNSYAGGDPRLANRKSKAGRVYVALTSQKTFWICSTLLSVKFHFKNAERYITNMDVPDSWTDFKSVNMTDASHVRDMETVQSIIDAGKQRNDVGKQGNKLHVTMAIPLDAGNRLLAKLAIAVGHKLFGQPFLDTNYSRELRIAFREADYSKRKKSAVRGTSYLSQSLDGRVEDILQFPGAWLLFLKETKGTLVLYVFTPSGQTMSVIVSDELNLIQTLEETYRDGVVWLTIPALETAVGPLGLPDYIAHQLGTIQNPQLSVLAEKKRVFESLPNC